MKNVLFLDFDGVMVTDRYQALLTVTKSSLQDNFGAKFDSVCVEFLKQVIDNTEADIVVTSTWKMEMGLDGIQEMWNARSLPGKVIGITPNIDPIHRGEEIAAWLDACGEECRYAIIDDTPFTEFFREEQLQHLFNVDERTGLDEDIMRKVIAYINRM